MAVSVCRGQVVHVGLVTDETAGSRDRRKRRISGVVDRRRAFDSKSVTKLKIQPKMKKKKKKYNLYKLLNREIHVIIESCMC